MAGYGDVKTRKFLRLVKWVGKTGEVEIEKGGKHNLKAHHIHTGSKYPLPTSHTTINKHVVKGFRTWLVKHKVCTEQEFDDHI